MPENLISCLSYTRTPLLTHTSQRMAQGMGIRGRYGYEPGREVWVKRGSIIIILRTGEHKCQW